MAIPFFGGNMLFLLLLLLCTPLEVHADYYTTVDSIEEARQIAIDNDIKLKSYDCNVAIYDKKADGLEKNNLATISSSPYDDTQKEAYDEIKLLNTYQHNVTGKGVTVAVIDTGCNIKHPDLRDNIIGTYNAFNPNSSSVKDTEGHGTHVAGIIASKDDNDGVVGIAPESKLYIIKADRISGFFFYADLIRGIYKCIELGNIDIINLSVNGRYPSDNLKEALLEAKRNGILIVTSAGNDGIAEPSYPAAYQVGLSVGTASHGQFALFSNKGINANIYLPGENIISTYFKESYIYLSGTSMSTGIASSIAALVCQKKKIHKNPDVVKNIIINSKGNLQKIFNFSKIKPPNIPKITITEDETKQKIITVNSSNDVYYNIDTDRTPGFYDQKYKKAIRLDKKGDYDITFVALKKNTRVFSKKIVINVEVDDKVYSQTYLNSLKLKCSRNKLYFTSKYKRKLNTSIVKWHSSNEKIATINNGVVTFKKKGKVLITAKIGNVKKHIILRR